MYGLNNVPPQLQIKLTVSTLHRFPSSCGQDCTKHSVDCCGKKRKDLCGSHHNEQCQGHLCGHAPQPCKFQPFDGSRKSLLNHRDHQDEVCLLPG